MKVTPTSANTASHIVAIPSAPIKRKIAFTTKAKIIFSHTITFVFLAIFIALVTAVGLSFIKTTSATSTAASEPNAPIATPTSALAKTGVSFKPSPTKITLPLSPISDLIFSTSVTLSCGNNSVFTLGIANFSCEIDKKHKTFKRKKDGVPYTEPHHLIPMAFQDEFDFSIDIEENIVSLCSNCHNEIHYGENARELITKLYYERKSLLEKKNIYISLIKLLSYYDL